MDSKPGIVNVNVKTGPTPQNYSFFLIIQFMAEQFYVFAIYFPWILLIKAFRISTFYILPPKIKSLKGEIILVTGGANGIGRAYCHELVRTEPQLTIVIWDVDEVKAKETVKELKELGVAKATFFIVDVTNRHKVAEVANKMRKEIGNVTMLFNNTGIAGQVGEGWKMNPDSVEKLISINLTSHIYTLREFLPAMIKRGKGHVIETCSVAGVSWAGHGSPYFASKHALRSYTECIKEDIRLLPNQPKINFTLVYPHVTQTKMQENNNLRSEYPFLVANQTAGFVGRKTIQGVLRNEENIFVPDIYRFLPIMLALYPVEMVRKFIDFAAIEKNRSF